MRWRDPELYELAGEFFREFSRMEYALKANRLLVQGRRNAEADWTAYARMVPDPRTAEDEEVKAAAMFLLEHPPRKQINLNGNLEWSDIPPDSESAMDLLLSYIRRARNNLFHGGKFNGQWFEPQRSGELLNASLLLLHYFRRGTPDVDRAYRE